MWHLKVEMDVLPITLFPGEYVDYMGEFVGQQLNASIVSKYANEDVPIIKLLTSYNQHKIWRIELNENLYWSDGQAITTKNLSYALTNLKLGRSIHRWFAKLLDCGSFPNGAFIKNALEMEIYLDQPIPFFEKICDSFLKPIPNEKQSPTVSSGPYIFNALSLNTGSLFLKKSLVGKRTHTGPDQIEFVLTKNGKEGIEKFNRGELDITANTTFPKDFIQKLNLKKEFVNQKSKLAASLVINTNKLNESKTLIQLLYSVIDRLKIATQLNGLASPINCYSSMWRNDICLKKTEALTVPERLDYLNNLTISYAEFEPNGFVVSQVIEQINRKTGLQWFSKALDYHSYFSALKNGDYDIMYSLQPAPFDHPFSFILPQIPHLEMNLTKNDRILLLIKESLPEIVDDDTAIHYASLCEDELALSNPSVPLLSINSIFLSKYIIPNELWSYNGFIQFIGLSQKDISTHEHIK